MARYEWTPDNLKRLRTLAVRGLTTEQLAEQLGASVPSVRTQLRVHKVDRGELNNFRKRWTDAQLKQLAKLAAEGVPTGVMAQRLGFSTNSVRYRLRTHKMKRGDVAAWKARAAAKEAKIDYSPRPYEVYRPTKPQFAKGSLDFLEIPSRINDTLHYKDGRREKI